MGKQYMVYIRVYGISAALLALSSKLSSGSTGSKQFPASFYTSPKCDTPPLIRSAVSVKPHASDTSTACADWYLSAWTAASQQEMWHFCFTEHCSCQQGAIGLSSPNAMTVYSLAFTQSGRLVFWHKIMSKIH